MKTVPHHVTFRQSALALAAALVALGSPLAAAPAAGDGWPAYPGTPGGPAAFVRADGRLLRNPDGSQFLIRGIAFGNQVWSNPASSAQLLHHGPLDYPRIKGMGFNTVRFYLNYGLFESDAKPGAWKADGFAWLDRNVAAARSQGIKLLLNMHVPPGGFQSNGDGDALWTKPANQDRLAALWKAIAERYRDEEAVLGYGLLNEPVPLEGVAQWTALARRLAAAIRGVDPHHLLFIERANWLKQGLTPADEANLFFPADLADPGPRPNIVWEFHLYDPMEFTHQNASWISAFKGKFTTYPDPARIAVSGEKWEWFSDGNPRLPAGTTNWTRLEGVNFPATKPAWMIGRPVIQAAGIGAGGSVQVADMSLEEADPAGKLIRTIAAVPLDSDLGWYFWSADGSGSGGLATGVAGARNGRCLQVSGTTGDANLGCNGYFFKVVPGNQYRISGRLKGSKVAAGATVRLRVDFYSCDSVQAWDKAYLESRVAAYRKFSESRNAPVYLGEFGAINDSFRSGRGGLRWLEDMLDILQAADINYNYHSYHEPAFGLFTNDTTALPDPASANQAAIDLFTAKQKGPGQTGQ